MNAAALIKKALVPAVVLTLVAGAALVLWPQSDDKTLVANFPRAVSVYEGSGVRVLGVEVGTVEKVEPNGTEVEVTMSYDPEVDLPADAKAVIISPSVVGDRYVQVTPAYSGGDVLADGAVLDRDRTAIPLELDQIYSNIDDLTVALGPDGANKEGALTDLLRQTAENFGGQGETFRQTVRDLGEFSGTLDENSEQLFNSAEQLQQVTSTLAEKDQTVRDFNSSLAEVSTMLKGERKELSDALSNLGVALRAVNSFVEENRDLIGSNVRGINRVLDVMVKQQKAMHEMLATAPVALQNLSNTYNGEAGTLDTNANLGSLPDMISADPQMFLCSMVQQQTNSDQLCNAISDILPRGSLFGAGTGSSYGVKTDPTLGGLVEVDER